MDHNTLLNIFHAIHYNQGLDAVFRVVDSINRVEKENGCNDILYTKTCTGCEAKMPIHNDECLICGDFVL